MHFITLHHSHSTNQHPATPDTTKTMCYRSAAQCWKAFLVSNYFRNGKATKSRRYCVLCFFYLSFCKKCIMMALVLLRTTLTPVYVLVTTITPQQPCKEPLVRSLPPSTTQYLLNGSNIHSEGVFLILKNSSPIENPWPPPSSLDLYMQKWNSPKKLSWSGE